eukprot:COSAG05_NODE_372_length_10695_cov_5.301623_2_plen_192_part_00
MCATVVLPLLFCHCYPATAILLCLSISNFLHGASLGSLNLPGLFVYSHVNHSHLDLQSHSSAIRQAGCSIVLQLASFTIKESRFPNMYTCSYSILVAAATLQNGSRLRSGRIAQRKIALFLIETASILLTFQSLQIRSSTDIKLKPYESDLSWQGYCLGSTMHRIHSQFRTVTPKGTSHLCSGQPENLFSA